MAFVTLENVYKRYHMGEVTINAADGMTFNIEKGEFAIIVGPSGSGKTTVLNMLGGMDTCDEGVISVDGARVDRFNRKQRTAGSLRGKLCSSCAGRGGMLRWRGG